MIFWYVFSFQSVIGVVLVVVVFRIGEVWSFHKCIKYVKINISLISMIFCFFFPSFLFLYPLFIFSFKTCFGLYEILDRFLTWEITLFTLSWYIWFEYITYEKSKHNTYLCTTKTIEKHANMETKANAKKSKQKIKGNQQRSYN